ncbi:MAG TPA: hypothetical protein VGL99_11485 [Chloroflexota bacterium]
MQQGRAFGEFACELDTDTVTQEYVDTWFDRDDSDREAAAHFDELGQLRAKPILAADLGQAERRALSTPLRRWQSDIPDYGADLTFGVALDALSTTGVA